jgi:hypothetical protein
MQCPKCVYSKVNEEIAGDCGIILSKHKEV